MSYKQIIKNAWKITWQYKWLLWFVLFRTLGGLLTFNYARIVHLFPNISFPLFLQIDPWSEGLVFWLYKAANQYYSINTVAVILSAILSILSILLSSFSTSALLQGLKLIHQGEKLSYSLILNNAFKSLWPIFMIDVIYSLFHGFKNLTSDFFQIRQNNNAALTILCISLPVIFSIMLFSTILRIVIVIEERNIFSAIQKTWKDILKPHLAKAIVLLFLGLVLIIIPVVIIRLNGILFSRTLISGLLPQNGFGIFLFFFLSIISGLIYTVSNGVADLFSNAVFLDFYNETQTEEPI